MIKIDSIPHKEHRYPTLGDYWEDANGNIQIRVSKELPNYYKFLIIIHELIEMYLCANDGVSFEDIDNFDIEFEKNRQPDNNDEPGDDPRAPYKTQHRFAENIERLVADKLGVNWNEYNKYCEQFCKDNDK